MTLRRQYQLGSDIFDTGPLSGYGYLGEVDDGGDTGGGGESTPDQIRYHRTYWYYVLPVYSDGDQPSTLHYAWTVYDNISDVGNTDPLASGTESTDEAADIVAQSAIDVLYDEAVALANQDHGLKTENIVYSVWQDVYHAHMVMEILTLSEAKAILSEQFNANAQALLRYPGQWVGGMANYNPDSFLEQFERSDRELNVNGDYNPTPPPNNYAIGEYISPSVGNAVLADQPVPGGSYHYWDGNMDTHDWGNHGISLTEIVDGTDGVTPGPPYKPYPKPIVDAIGGYAMCISHYLADYDNTTGAFNGFRVLTAAELSGGVPAGLPIATVMQMFVKCAKTRSGKDFDGFTWTGANFYYDTEKNPIWRKSVGMPMEPASFFLLEPELAVESKIAKITNQTRWDVVQNTQWISSNDAESWNKIGYNDVPGTFKEKRSRQDVLNRNFGGIGWGSYRAVEKSKRPFGAKVEYLGEGGQFNEFSVHPPNIPDCNTDGKTMVIFRFPRQLDPVADKNTIDLYANDPGVPDYSFEFTKYCYPYPGASIDKDEYALLGRLMPTNSDDIGADKFTAEIDGETFGGRQSIKFVPMITPSMPPSTSHRPYFIGKPSTMTDMKQKMSGSVAMLFLLDKVDYFCFDTTSVSGATISVADPHKTAYFNNSRINNAYFINRDFDVGSTAFAIGQCMLSYEKDSAAIDNRLGLVDSSERMILTTRTDRLITSYWVGRTDVSQSSLRSDDIAHRSPRDGTAAGNSMSDYLIPTMTMTTDDLLSGEEPVGALAVRETFEKIFGYPLTPEWFATLNLPGQDPNDPTRYIVNTSYGTFSYPYSIVGFTIPGYYVGPVLKYDAEGNPVGATEQKPGYIGDKSTFLMYQSPFGHLKKHTINFHDEIQTQSDIEDGGGSAEDAFEDDFGEDYGDVTQENQETIQYEEWLLSRLMEDHGNTRFTDTGFKANFRIWNQDYVLGKDLINAGYPIPGVDISSYEAEAETAGIPVYSTTDEPTQIQGLGAFTNSEGFTVTDVTAKWGTLGMAKKRYTGDVGMSMVPYSANVQDEQLGYMAMSNLDGIGGFLDDAKDTGKDLAMETAKWSGIAAGGGAAVAMVILAGGAATAMVTKGGISAIMGGFKSRKDD